MGSNEWCASNLKSHIDIATRCVCIGGMTSDPNGSLASGTSSTTGTRYSPRRYVGS